MFGWLRKLFERKIYRVRIDVMSPGWQHNPLSRIHVHVDLVSEVVIGTTKRTIYTNVEGFFVSRGCNKNDCWYTKEEVAKELEKIYLRYRTKPRVSFITLTRPKPTPPPPPKFPDRPINPYNIRYEGLEKLEGNNSPHMAYTIFREYIETRYPKTYTQYLGYKIVRGREPYEGLMLLNSDDIKQLNYGDKYYVINMDTRTIYHPQACAGRTVAALEMQPHIHRGSK